MTQYHRQCSLSTVECSELNVYNGGTTDMLLVLATLAMMVRAQDRQNRNKRRVVSTLKLEAGWNIRTFAAMSRDSRVILASGLLHNCVHSSAVVYDCGPRTAAPID